jgi:hypothetical protein
MKARTKDRLRRFAKLKNHTARILTFLLAAPESDVVEPEIPAFVNLQLFRSRGLGTLELSSRDKSLADCQFPGNLGQGRDS